MRKGLFEARALTAAGAAAIRRSLTGAAQPAARIQG
jgi:hypothetical protein